MGSSRKAVLALALAGGLIAGALGFGAAAAGANPLPPPDPSVGEPPPPWAPRKPADFFAGHPVVWSSAYDGRWGVWINGGFIPLTKNPWINAG
ncbi:hypothetical protein MHAS_01761 [Mycolicibacterium hassiacum DSM 44199]|jgi:hypothetical protein|uniref:hypothetical protein n=1 Tax=Mycolicibacterium hassiacum TaxID=46351 RepID=UPI000DB5C77E|nr:hypothetical protein [Mycolicibacterium hassiacum]PZN22750.1 MAG: hypothetical protein DIU75_07025 [Mycolicibacterium hassiacum]VCT90054.1 hypothetical protein MHAS_01758 [Mycolicibacterium hassiacum DSM 44199]VCT90057.1 hypothetical protein MHAS_01761 [Mycolicibacterium hassiacum DSM 44199]